MVVLYVLNLIVFFLGIDIGLNILNVVKIGRFLLNWLDRLFFKVWMYCFERFGIRFLLWVVSFRNVYFWSFLFFLRFFFSWEMCFSFDVMLLSLLKLYFSVGVIVVNEIFFFWKILLICDRIGSILCRRYIMLMNLMFFICLRSLVVVVLLFFLKYFKIVVIVLKFLYIFFIVLLVDS